MTFSSFNHRPAASGCRATAERIRIIQSRPLCMSGDDNKAMLTERRSSSLASLSVGAANFCTEGPSCKQSKHSPMETFHPAFLCHLQSAIMPSVPRHFPQVTFLWSGMIPLSCIQLLVVSPGVTVCGGEEGTAHCYCGSVLPWKVSAPLFLC